MAILRNGWKKERSDSIIGGRWICNAVGSSFFDENVREFMTE